MTLCGEMLLPVSGSGALVHSGEECQVLTLDALHHGGTVAYSDAFWSCAIASVLFSPRLAFA